MRQLRGRIWRVIMILVVTVTWNTMCLLLGVVDLGGVLPPFPGNVVPCFLYPSGHEGPLLDCSSLAR